MPDDTDREKVERAIDRVRSAGWRVLREEQSFGSGPALVIPQLDRLFSGDGSLRDDLSFEWREGLASRVQTAFAREGLVVRAALEQDSGVAVCVAGRAPDSDLCRIVQSFRELEADGYIAEPDFSLTTTGGWEDVHQRVQGELRAIFWISQAHVDCFDDEGNLVDDLPLHWAGDATAIAEALRSTGLLVEIPEIADITFFISPVGEEEDDVL
ncbi:hypothetical protein [Streptomyces antimycoticus]|uniref:hypothetical protein n=1 Tax=Streptomyces antimycoticus TaxID=68175 RepID=UPI0033DCE434